MVWEASQLWFVCLNILEARADSRFYRVLLKLLGMPTATGSQGYSVLIAWLYLGYVCVGFRNSQAVFILVTRSPTLSSIRPCIVLLHCIPHIQCTRNTHANTTFKSHSKQNCTKGGDAVRAQICWIRGFVPNIFAFPEMLGTPNSQEMPNHTNT